MTDPAPRTFSFSRWFPFAVAACLMALAVGQAAAIFRLHAELRALQAEADAASTQAARLRESYALLSLRLAQLDVRDPAYAAGKVLVAWDASQHRGAVALQGVPPAPAGHDYELWVLDPNALSPVCAGIVTAHGPFSRTAGQCNRPGLPVVTRTTGRQRRPDGAHSFLLSLRLSKG